MFGLALLTGRRFAWDTDSPIQMLASVTLEAAWLPPLYHQLFWMFPAAATALLIPCFLMSVLIEGLVSGSLLERSGSAEGFPGRVARQPLVVPGIVHGGLLLVSDEYPKTHIVFNSGVQPAKTAVTRPPFEKRSSQDWLQQGGTMQLIPTGTGWRLSMDEGYIQGLEIDYRLGFLLGDKTESARLWFASPCRIKEENKVTHLVPESATTLAPALALFNAKVTDISFEKTGQLSLHLKDGRSVEVDPDEQFEAWEISSDTLGGILTCPPGGDLSRFKN
jgi:hypothetical protein